VPGTFYPAAAGIVLADLVLIEFGNACTTHRPHHHGHLAALRPHPAPDPIQHRSPIAVAASRFPTTADAVKAGLSD